MAPGEDEARRVAEQVARRSYGKLVALLAARTGDVAGAEDALADAFAAALAHWPAKGAPANPEAWLLTTARRKRIDAARRGAAGEAARRKLLVLHAGLEAGEGGEGDAFPDRRLALLFACAHPAIDRAVHAPLMLQTVMGLEAARIASAFLVSPAAMAQRLVRAKAKIREAAIPFAIPGSETLPDRLGAVLGAVYAAFGEGWADPLGVDPGRRDLVEEALFLARLIVELAPDQPEPKGLLAMMLYAEARRGARRAEGGAFVPFAEQPAILWDGGMIEAAEALLHAAAAQGRVGRYQLEAALQSAHVHRRRTGRDNWAEIVALYDGLLALSASPVVAVNRAVALAEAGGAAAGLAALDAVAADPRLATYQPYWAARAELLARTGDGEGAACAYDLAIGLEADPAVRVFLQGRRQALRDGAGTRPWSGSPL